LQNNISRKSKVNLRPRGTVDGELVSDVILIDGQINLSESLISNGYGKSNCVILNP
tara:strand:- start:2263 stop:2430 length:168 start_codon:yes stop_codon:yes gene_type:complete